MAVKRKPTRRRPAAAQPARAAVNPRTGARESPDKPAVSPRAGARKSPVKPAVDPRAGARKSPDKPARERRIGAQTRAKPGSRGKPGSGVKATGAIPAIYERYLVPMIFEPYAWHLAARVALWKPTDVLEVAARTGVVTRELARRLPDARIVATDRRQEMIDHAAKRIRDPRITWRQADAQALPFDDASFDAVVCQFSATSFADKVKAYTEAKRVLRPGGMFLFNVWDRIEANQFANEAMKAVAALYPDDPPRFLSTPHSYHDQGTIRAHLKEAGFTRVTIAAVEHRSEAVNARYVAIAMCQGSPMRGELEERGLSVKEATDAAAAAIAERFGERDVEGLFRALVVEAM